MNALKDYHASHAAASGGTGQPCIIEEVARAVMHQDGFQAEDLNDGIRGLQLQMRILEEQNTVEERMGDNWYIADRSGLDALVYAKEYVGPDAWRALARTTAWAKTKSRMQAALVVVCEAGNTEWLSTDTTRRAYESTAEWKALNQAFYSALEEHEIAYAILLSDCNDVHNRVDFVNRLSYRHQNGLGSQQ